MFAERTIARIDLFQRLALMLIIGVIPLVVDPYISASFVDTKFLMIQLLVLFLLATGAVKLALGGLYPRVSWVSVVLIGLVGLYVVHCWTDPDPAFARVKALKYSLFLLLPLLIVSAFKTSRQIAVAEHFLIWMTLPMLAYATAQYLGYELWEYQYEFEKSKVQGTLGNSHFLGGYLAILVFIVLHRIRQSRSPRLQVFYLFLLPVILFLLIVSRSRGAMLCVAGAAFCFLGVRAFIGWRQSGSWLWKWVLACWLAVVVLSPAAWWWSGRRPLSNPIRSVELKFHRDRSINNRLVLAVISLRMWGQHPWWGVGVDRYPVEFHRTLLESAHTADFHIIRHMAQLMESTQANEAHNDFLQCLAEMGLVGYGLLVALCCLLFYGLAKLLRQRRHTLRRADLRQVTCLLPALLTVFAQMLYSFPLHLPSNGVLGLVVFGWSVVLFRQYGILEFQRPRWGSLGLTRHAVALALVMLSVWGGYTVLRQYLGLALMRAGIVAEEIFRDLDQAALYMEQGGYLFPENGEIDYCQARIYAQSESGRRKALAKLDEASLTYANSAIPLVRSQILLDMFRFSDALKPLEQLSLITTRLDNLHLARGMVFYYNREFAKAAEEYEQELQINPDNEQALLYLAQSHFELGNYYRAEQLFAKAIESRMKSIQVVERLGDIYSGPRFMPQRARAYYYQALRWALQAGDRQNVRQLERKIADLERKIRLKMENPRFRSRIQTGRPEASRPGPGWVESESP